MDNNSNPSNDQAKKPETLTPKELVRKHMADPNHVLTDEELKNVQVGSDVKPEELTAKEEELKNQHPNDELPNPYSILGD